MQPETSLNKYLLKFQANIFALSDTLFSAKLYYITFDPSGERFSSLSCDKPVCRPVYFSVLFCCVFYSTVLYSVLM